MWSRQWDSALPEVLHTYLQFPKRQWKWNLLAYLQSVARQGSLEHIQHPIITLTHFTHWFLRQNLIQGEPSWSLCSKHGLQIAHNHLPLSWNWCWQCHCNSTKPEHFPDWDYWNTAVYGGCCSLQGPHLQFKALKIHTDAVSPFLPTFASVDSDSFSHLSFV